MGGDLLGHTQNGLLKFDMYEAQVVTPWHGCQNGPLKLGPKLCPTHTHLSRHVRIANEPS